MSAYLFPPQFYVLENALELYARDMLFLALSLETPQRMGLQGESFKHHTLCLKVATFPNTDLQDKKKEFSLNSLDNFMI